MRSHFVQVREEDSNSSEAEHMADSILPGYTRAEAGTLAHGWLARVYLTEACLLVWTARVHTDIAVEAKNTAVAAARSCVPATGSGKVELHSMLEL